MHCCLLGGLSKSSIYIKYITVAPEKPGHNCINYTKKYVFINGFHAFFKDRSYMYS